MAIKDAIPYVESLECWLNYKQTRQSNNTENPREAEAMTESVLMAKAIRNNTMPPDKIAARLRGDVLAYRACAPVITAYMDAIADRLTKP